MKRPAAALTFVLLAATAAGAQSYPGDGGAGTQRGIEGLNNSGQIGTVTVLRRDPNTLIALDLHGTDGRPQSVRIYRGRSCDDLAPRPMYFLADAKNGVSRSSVSVGADTLLSGNYNVVVFSTNRTGARTTACGHLY